MIAVMRGTQSPINARSITATRTALSTFRSSDFAKAYGVAIVDGPLAGLTARAVVVLDAANQVLHAELVPEITQEPDYAAALAAVK